MNGNSVSPTLLKSGAVQLQTALPHSSSPPTSTSAAAVSPETTSTSSTSSSSMHQLGQQLLCMNSLFSINPNGSSGSNGANEANTPATVHPNTTSSTFSSKEQLAEQYQLAKLRLNQDLLGASAFYASAAAAAAFPAYAYTTSPYAEAVGGGKMAANHLTLSGYHAHHRFRYGAHATPPSLAHSAHHHHPHHHPHLHHHHQLEDPKPQHSYIGLIAMAILSMPDQKMVLSDIYQHILDHYPYFRNRGPGWRNSIRHNLSLNDCFIKSGRSANGKGHYWAIHPANLEDFRKGDFRRRKAQRKVRKHMGLSVPDDDEDDDDDLSPGVSPIPPGVGVGMLSAEKAAVAAAAAALLSSSSSPHGGTSNSPNSFVQAISAAGNSPSLMFQLNSAANLVASSSSSSSPAQQAFNFFNSLRFAAAGALPPPPPPPPTSAAGAFQPAASMVHQVPLPPAAAGNVANFNETLYRQLINLNIRQDLQSAVNRAAAAAAAVAGRKGCSEFSIESLLSQQHTSEQQQQQQQQLNSGHNGYSNGLLHHHHHHPLFHHQSHLLSLHQRTASTEDSDVDSEAEAFGRGGKGGNDSELSVEEEVMISSSSSILKCEHGSIKQQQQHLQPVNLKIN